MLEHNWESLGELVSIERYVNLQNKNYTGLTQFAQEISFLLMCLPPARKASRQEKQKANGFQMTKEDFVEISGWVKIALKRVPALESGLLGLKSSGRISISSSPRKVVHREINDSSSQMNLFLVEIYSNAQGLFLTGSSTEDFAQNLLLAALAKMQDFVQLCTLSD
ncbi:hypothetical protein P4O66_001825 [Electrophorus voltai]|uniref:Uncharacterized protein n=1 Tax=Electrophorus voltai TaxID=2609070 RepID=A0AAD9DUD7_9TELE|nr:hypothetical protein P4O66_001825 [Electrophorus voltai]